MAKATWVLRDKLPSVFFRNDTTGDLATLIDDVLQPVLDKALAEHDLYKDVNDVHTATENQVNAMLADLGNTKMVRSLCSPPKSAQS